MVPAVLLFAIVLPACRDTPSFPTFAQASPPQAPAPTPSTELLGQWNVTARLTAADGDKCTMEAVRSLIGTPREYSITLTQTGSEVDVTVTARSGDYDCTFRHVAADKSGFSSSRGTSLKCRAYFATHDFHCSDGTLVNLLTWGEDVSGIISGNELSGRWGISWVEMMRRSANLDSTTEFTGPRQ